MSSSRVALTARVKAEAQRLGFHLVGVADCRPPETYPAYVAWLQHGHHAAMAYMARERNRERRADPKRILPECKSILVLGIRYFQQDAQPMPADGRPRGRVASYAWGEDYHDILVARLRALVAFLEAELGHPVPNRYYTDTGPVLEREFAQRAGLGWVGKNGMLINPKLGSYLILAEILLGVALEPDAPFATDHCGTCTRCIDACPTQAILPTRTVDANRCLSYLTIENKGEIPQDLRARLGEWVFGCDVCQMVCPWNRRAPLEGDPAFAPRPGVPRPLLTEEIRLSRQAFNRKFKGSPIKRTKRRGYLRNVAVALGNAAQPHTVEALREALQDEEPLVRGHAAWALGQIATAEACEALRRALHVEEDPEVREEIRAALAACA
ncbi:MAG: tRNA epoxyqueuosine(34) reductase QueG [Chloroflexi bacterium]|nr:tRNA epoxyqueuosine(34) reductase QueG [Chloroflexota bacterium]